VAAHPRKRMQSLRQPAPKRKQARAAAQPSKMDYSPHTCYNQRQKTLLKGMPGTMTPSSIVAPPTPKALAEALAEAAAERRPVAPWGAGLHQHLGAPAPGDALLLSTAGLSHITEYAPADLTITLESGARLAAVQAELGANGQWLPWDAPGSAGATIGGLLAAGRSGPLRLGYGGPRDWLLGAHVALGDGRLVKSGGKVVKNVAGYDAHKLHIGALGTLGILTSVTFKLAPVPERMETLGYRCARQEQLVEAAELLRRPPLAPVSLVVLNPRAAARLPGDISEDQSIVLARYAGVDRAVERQLREARDNLASLSLRGEIAPIDVAHASAWATVAEFATPAGSDIVLRIGVRPTALDAAIALLSRLLQPTAELAGYPGIGLLYARLSPELPSAASLAQALSELRSALAPHEGYLVVEAAPPALRARLDLWGPPPATLPIMQRLKAQWDPAGILNPGRYLPGL
jgi:glycolate oxidase FAD binding subunit